ncbi:MAG: methylmalonyl-CoA mutase family protein [Enhygromyxa sp.]
MSDAQFSPVTRAQWVARAERELGGRPLQSLTRTTAEGVDVAPLYLREDVEGAPGRAGLGTRSSSRWRTVQEYRHADPEAANAAARRDLELGADGLCFVLDSELRAGREPSSPADGLVADPTCDLDSLLAGIDPASTPVFVDAGLLAPVWADAIEQWMDSHSGAPPGPEPALLGRGAGRGGVIYDPLTPLLRTGSLELGFEAALVEQVDAMLGRTVGLIGVSTCPYHDAGASDAEELALALSSCAELLRRGEPLGLEAADIASGLIWTVAIAGRPFEAIAKLRAARLCWAKFASACGLTSEQGRLWIHASASQRTWTRYGPWVNLLRGTIGTFAAAVGGADSIATASFDGLRGPEDGTLLDGLGRGSELGRRLAIDTQVILREESGLDRTLDPAGGSWYVEALTEALARAAWQRFRELEGDGGLVANLVSGAVQERIAAGAERLRERVATRKQPITGVSTYPSLDDQPTPEQPRNQSERDVSGLLRSTPTLEPAEIPKLPVVRLAAPFEALRDQSEAWARQRGARPRIFALNLGPLAAHQARAEFAANLFGAGGLELVASEGFDALEPALAGFAQSGCELVVICGRDEDYAKLVPPLIPALREAGAAQIWVAGRPPAAGWGLEPSLSPASIFLGCDALAACELALRTLGVITDSGAEG